MSVGRGRGSGGGSVGDVPHYVWVGRQRGTETRVLTGAGGDDLEPVGEGTTTEE